MYITHVQLENFKSHEHFSAELCEEMNLVVGMNYSGKSTILHAILVGLFGVSAAPGAADDLVLDGKKSFKVRLTFSNGAQVVRTKQDSQFFEPTDTTPSVRSHTAVSARVLEMLGVSKQTFLKVFVSGQGEPQQLLNMEGAQLQKFIEQCVNLEDLADYAKFVSAKVAEETGVVKFLEVSQVPKEEIEELERVCAEIPAKIEDCEKQMLSLEAAQKHWDNTLSDWQDKEKAARKLAGQWEAYEEGVSRIESLERDLNDVPDLIDVADQERWVDLANKELAEAEATARAAQRLQNTIKQITKDIEANPISLTPPETSSENLRVRLDGDLKEDVLRLDREIYTITQKIKTGVCPECKRPFDEHFDESLLRETLDALTVERTQAESARAQLSAEYTRTVKLEEEIRRVTSLRTRLENDLQDKQKELASLPEIGDVQRLGDLLEEAKKELSRSRDNNSLRSSELRKREQISSLKERTLPPAAPAPDLSSIVRSVVEAKTALDSTVQQKIGVSGKLSEIKGELRRAEGSLQGASKASSDLVAHSDLLRDLQHLHTILATVRKDMANEALSYILETTSEFVRRCTGGDMERVYLTDGGIRCDVKGVSRPKTSLSGTQKTLIGLGLKIALVSVVDCAVPVMLLDEVSADMDPVISSSCLITMRDFCSQTIIVSHTSSDTADNVISL